MPTPTPSWQTVRVHGTWVNQDGSMKAGSYKVTMPVRVTNSTDDVIIPKGVFASGSLNTTSGLPSLDVQVPASDDPDNSPQGFQPTIEITFLDAPGELYALTVPVALSGNAGGIDLATVILTDTLPIPAEVFIRGVAGGLAELDSAGDVVDAAGNKVKGSGAALLVVPTVTASATLAAGKHTPVDATSGAKTMTLPTTAAAGVLASVEKTDASANAVTVTGTLRGATSSIPLTSQFEARTFLSEGSGSWRPVSDHRTASSLSAAFVGQVKASGDTTGATDTAAIQARLDLGGVVHLLGPATYYVKGLVMKSNSHLYINGATLKLPNGANDDVITTANFAALAGTGAGTITDGIRHAGIYGPGVIDGNKANQTTSSTTIAAGSNGVTLPTGTVNVASTTGFPTAGWFSVQTTTGVRAIAYTGKTATTFTGCTGGSGSLSTGTPVYGKGFGILAYWSNSSLGGLGGLDVRNCFADGVWTEWGTGTDANVSADGAMENTIRGLKCYFNGRNGLTHRGSHDSWLSQVIVFDNGVCGASFNGFGSAYVNQIHAWGGPQQIGVDLYTEVHFAGPNAIEVTGVAGSVGLRANFVRFTYKGRIFLFNPNGQPAAGAIGLMLRSCSLAEVDAEISDCTQGAIVVTGDAGNNNIKAVCKQDRGPAIARLVTTVASASNGVDVATFTGSGTLNVANSGALGIIDAGTFPNVGAVMVRTSTGSQLVTYTGRSATTLTGCSSSGTGTVSTGGIVTFVNQLNGGTANDTATVAATSAWNITTLGGTTAPSFSNTQTPVASFVGTGGALDNALGANYGRVAGPGVLWGNSRIGFEWDTPAAGQSASSWLGSFSWANARAGGRLRVVNEAGVAGETLAQMSIRFGTDVAPYAPKWVLIADAVNDASANRTTAQMIADTQVMLGQVKGIGAIPILMTSPPRNVNTTAQRDALNGWNQWVKSQDGNGCYVIDVAPYVTDASTGGWQAAATSDNLHQNQTGALMMSSPIATFLKARGATASPYPSSPLDATQWLPNPWINGTPGSTFPAEWTTFGTATFSIVARTDGLPGNWAQAAAAAAGGQFVSSVQTAIPASVVPGTTKIRLVTEVSSDAWTSATSMGSRVEFYSTGTTIVGATYAVWCNTGGTLVGSPANQPGLDGPWILQSPVYTVPAGTTTYKVLNTFNGVGTIRFGRHALLTLS